MTGQKMENASQFAAYVPCATYFHDSDCVEYVKRDSLLVYDRVDQFLTLIFDGTGKQLVGFKLKGFKNLFTKQLAPMYRLNNRQFVGLVPALEAICQVLGGQLEDDDDRKQSYRAAMDLAANDNVSLSGAHLAALAA
ncbi:MAG: hypothetical protein RLN94_22220 [Roseovarius sp.]|uniref:hypothetical protein n=1 Tax=Roseovarius sp. TaxID=1486281 RepID=UPI0032EAB520